MASLALRLKNYPKKPSQTLPNSSPTLTFSHLFSTSSSSSNDNNNNNDDNSQKPPSIASYLSDIKSRLKNQEQQQQQQKQQATGSRPFNFAQQSSPNPPKVASLEEIRMNLSEFRRRSSVPSPESQPPVKSQNSTSLQDLYERNVNTQNPNPSPGGPKYTSFEVIRSSLSKLRASKSENSNKVNDQMSLNKYKENFSLNLPMGDSSGKVYGGSSMGLPESVFGKEMKEKEKKKGEVSSGEEEEDTAFIKPYTFYELGKQLRDLRPEPVKKSKKAGEENWFSLGELNERLKKFREIEMKRMTDINGNLYGMRNTLQTIMSNKSDKEKASRIQRFDMFSRVSGSMQSPPKEHLVEKYFHPDNMSSEEKLKLELKKVRDEFKMHESDCGSARVQIAQLTTEILHLSSVLHKKDKHSRRGLLAKVQQRKKLLKYLRRTDWDSYCFVLSKLGLRDNPDYKN